MVSESLQQKLTRARAEASENTIEKLSIPGYGGSLVGCYHLLGWKQRSKIASTNAKLTGKDRDDKRAQIELNTCADTLVASCDHIEVRCPADADEKTKAEVKAFNEAGHKLNVAFAEYLGLHDSASEGITDRQAVYLIIPSDTQMVVHAGLLMEKQGIVDEDVDKDLLGESEAAS